MDVFKMMIQPEDVDRMRANSREQALLKGTRAERDYEPVVMLHVPQTRCVWLLTELDEDGIAFGLCDLGMGEPELGSVSLWELAEVNVRGLRVRQAQEWRSLKTLSAYAAEARHSAEILP